MLFDGSCRLIFLNFHLRLPVRDLKDNHRQRKEPVSNPLIILSESVIAAIIIMGISLITGFFFLFVLKCKFFVSKD
jgi:hypothetical protein